MSETLDTQVQLDFDKARSREFFSKIFSLVKNREDELLSFYDVKELIRPKSATYKGIISIPMTHIAGSEGRYKDFNRHFLPKYTHLRQRWERVDLAHYKDISLPAIKVYELGGLYFVRDGNHRVSVAKAQGQEFIDAEVLVLNSEISLDPKMTRESLKKEVINYEKKLFMEQTHLNKLRPKIQMDFTNIGNYDKILSHIDGHKYFLNQDHSGEIPFKMAMLSWYDNVYAPIVNLVLQERLLDQFHDRKPGDLYMWIVKRWDELKNQYGHCYSLQDAVKKVSQERKEPFFTRIANFIKSLFA